jgi:nucleoid-associated protein
MTRLKINLEKENLATGGHLLFIYMTSQEKDLFMVAMVKDKKGLMFNEKLELLDIKELDLNKLNQAIRINITQWLGKTEKAYLSFLKKGPGDVAQYFLDTFGCTDSIPSKTSTKAVFDVAEALCETAGQSIQATKSIKDQICKYLEENPKEVLLGRISLIVDANLPNEFEGQYLDLANSEEYQISNVFSPNKLILQSYKKIIHETSKWKIKLDKDVIGSTDSDKEIVYNPEDQTLTFKDLPPSLKAELLNALERNDDQ